MRGSRTVPRSHERHTEATAEHAEDRVLGRHPQVAPECQLDTAGHRVALRRRRSPAWTVSSAGRPHGPGTVVGDRPAVPLGHRLQVGTGAEGAAGPGEHGHGAARRHGRRPGRPPRSWSAQTLSTALRRSGRSIVIDGDRAVVLDEQRVGPVGRVGPRGRLVSRGRSGHMPAILARPERGARTWWFSFVPR